MNNLPLARKSDLVMQEVGDELLVYDLKTNKAYCLNETSAQIWLLCDGKNSVSEIAKKMSEQMKTEITEDFIRIALDQLNKDEILEDGLEIRFNGLSRREIIRKVGFASVAAMPIISSVVAPEGSMAQSGPMNLSFGDACTAHLQCTSGVCSTLISTCCVSTSRTNAFGTGSNFTLTGTETCVASAQTRCCSGSGFFTGITSIFMGITVFKCECN